MMGSHDIAVQNAFHIRLEIDEVLRWWFERRHY